MFKGYCPNDALPDWLQPGRKVRIPPGTPLRSTHPSLPSPRLSKRWQTVTVNHVRGGTTLTLGTVYAEGKFYPSVRLKDVVRYAERRGMADPWRDADATFEFLRNHEDAELRPWPMNPKINDVKLHASPPCVCWAGSGGYWVWADLNLCISV